MRRKEERKEGSEIELGVSPSEVFRSRKDKKWAQLFHNCDNKILITKNIQQMRMYSIVYLNEEQLKMQLFDVEDSIV